jgi:pimeloyl-ACP methyl ester carboxylesterase
MTAIKKSALLGLVGLSFVFGIAFVYIQNIATGQNPNWDPESYTTVAANGLEFSVNIEGDMEDTPVVLLHGFPEAAIMWGSLIDKLTANGYYAIAPNQRGYSSGARPTDADAYQLENLASDVLEIANSLGIKQFHLVGHDWGAGVGWQLAAKHPERILSYVAISVPHIDAFGKAYREDSAQYEASDYIRFFQKPIIPEFVLAKSGYENLKSVWTNHDASEIEHYQQIFSQRHALSSALNWYRANFPAFEVGLNIGKVEVPTTLIWGNQDIALKRSGVEATEALVTAPYQFIEMEAGHWIIQEKPSELNKHVLRHLAEYR